MNGNTHAAVVIDHSTFSQMTMQRFVDLEKTNRVLKELMSYPWSSPHYFVTDISGEMFQFLHHKFGDTNIITLWNNSGRVGMGDIKVKSDDPNATILSHAADQWKEMYQRMSDYTNGIIHCADCGNTLKLHEPHGTYFAGHFCDDCWERKWKAIAAAETYE